jgi:hypothetical protein
VTSFGDVLEVMAEEIAGRPADPLASFTTWDGGRRKLDGMARGRRGDIDREQRAFEKEQADLKALETWRRQQRWRKRHRAQWLAIQKAYYQAAHDKLIAKARLDNYRSYRRHQEERKKKQRAYWAAKRGTPPRPHKPYAPYRCSACGQTGHSKRTCGRMP